MKRDVPRSLCSDKGQELWHRTGAEGPRALGQKGVAP